MPQSDYTRAEEALRQVLKLVVCPAACASASFQQRLALAQTRRMGSKRDGSKRRAYG